METITIQNIKEQSNGWKLLVTPENHVYHLGPNKAQVEEGKAYNVTTVWKEREGKRKAYVIEIKPVGVSTSTPPPSPKTQAKPNGLTPKDEQIEKLSHQKSESMARMNALNAASQMCESVSRMMASSRTVTEWTDSQITNHLKTLKDAEFRNNLELLGIKANQEDGF